MFQHTSLCVATGLIAVLALGAVACGDDDDNGSGSSGGTAGASDGGQSTGGQSTGGQSTGGMESGGAGGMESTGGVDSGGAGGDNVGGAGGATPDLDSIAEIVTAAADGDNDGEFDVLLALVADSTVNLVGPLADDDETLTAFAPTDAAFVSAVQALTGASTAPTEAEAITTLLGLDADEVRATVLYHVLPTVVNSTAAITAGEANAGAGTAVETYAGAQLQVSYDGTDLMVDDATVDTSTAGTTFDIQASNGTIHVIDAVLLPSVIDMVASLDQFSTLAGVVESNGLYDALDLRTATLTFFAPNDTVLDPIATALTTAGIDVATHIGHILTYHVYADAQLNAADITADATLLTLGGNVEVTTTGGIQVDGIEVTTPDIGSLLASNGVIHEIGGVLVPSITDVVVSSDDFTGLLGLITASDTSTTDVAAALDADASTGFYTLFAPSNGAITGLSINPAPSGQDLTDVLTFHVLNETNRVFAADALGVTNMAFDTLLTGEQVTVDGNSGSGPVTVGPADDGNNGNTGTAEVTQADIYTSNGVIHVVDAVLIPDP